MQGCATRRPHRGSRTYQVAADDVAEHTQAIASRLAIAERASKLVKDGAKDAKEGEGDELVFIIMLLCLSHLC